MSFLDVRNLRTYYRIQAGTVKAVDGVSFSLDRGESFGLIGESGSGKSTVALSILRLLPDSGFLDSGSILLEGKDLLRLNDKEIKRIRGGKISLVFQGALNAFNPVKRLGDQIAEGIMLHDTKMPRSQALSKTAHLFDLMGIEASRISDYPHQFSGGMKQRAMIAMALSCDPELIIADEPVTALDVMIQAQIIELLNELKSKLKVTLLLITHDLSVVMEVCEKIAVMYGGKILEVSSVTNTFLHPYTQKLFESFPDIEKSKEFGWGIPGAPPDLIDPPRGCRFHPRCDSAIARCREEEPKVIEVHPGHGVSCHLVG